MNSNKYKEINLYNLKEIPLKWTLSRLKNVSEVLTSNIDKKSRENETSIYLCNYTDVYYNNIINSKINFMKATASINQIRKFKLNKDDVIITKDSESPYDIGVPTWVGEDFENVVCGYHLSLIKPNTDKINGRYLFYCLSSPGFREHFWNHANGVTRYGISKSSIMNTPVLLPEKEVQEKIACFLDQKTSEIDALISDKEKLIKLLEEKRQAIITEAVTKGLDPDVKMKDSGVEWIGEIPEHWETKKIKHLLNRRKGSIKTGPFGSHLSNKDMESDYKKVFNQKNVLKNNFSIGDYYVSKDKYKELNSFKAKSGDLLITTRGTIGKAAIVPENTNDGILHPCLIKLDINRSYYNPHLLKLIFNETNIIKEQVHILSNSTTIEVIYSETLKNIFIPISLDLKIQNEIVARVEEKKKDYLLLINRISHQINKLKEYRQALIYEAVTGKIDVQEMVKETEQEEVSSS